MYTKAEIEDRLDCLFDTLEGISIKMDKLGEALEEINNNTIDVETAVKEN